MELPLKCKSKHRKTKAAPYLVYLTPPVPPSYRTGRGGFVLYCLKWSIPARISIFESEIQRSIYNLTKVLLGLALPNEGGRPLLGPHILLPASSGENCVRSFGDLLDQSLHWLRVGAAVIRHH